jgi:hypothetical protein
VQLREGIVCAIVEAEGWDLDALDETIDHSWDSSATRDAMALWVERGPTAKEPA